MRMYQIFSLFLALLALVAIRKWTGWQDGFRIWLPKSIGSRIGPKWTFVRRRLFLQSRWKALLLHRLVRRVDEPALSAAGDKINIHLGSGVFFLHTIRQFRQ